MFEMTRCNQNLRGYSQECPNSLPSFVCQESENLSYYTPFFLPPCLFFLVLHTVLLVSQSGSTVFQSDHCNEVMPCSEYGCVRWNTPNNYRWTNRNNKHATLIHVIPSALSNCLPSCFPPIKY